MRMWDDVTGSERGPVAGGCEYDDKRQVSIGREEISC